MISFVDTSVVLRYILEGDITLHHAFSGGTGVCSELLWIEGSRVLQRHRLQGNLDDSGLAEAVQRLQEVYSCFRVYLLDERIRQMAAGPFPTIIGTLDAMHLSCAQRCSGDFHGEILLVYTYDRQMNTCAQALGFSTPLMERSV